MARSGWNRPVAPSKGAAKGEYQIVIIPAQTVALSTTSITYTMINRVYQIRWDPASWPSGMNWYLEAPLDGYGDVAVFEYDTGTANITGSALCSASFSTAMVNPPLAARGSAGTMPSTTKLLTVAFRQTSGAPSSLKCYGARLIGIPV